MRHLVIDHHVHADPELLFILRAILRRMIKMATDLSRITAEVTEMSSAADSAIALLGELAQMIRDNATDPAALNELANTLDAKGTALAEAVAANTPAEEPTEPDVGPGFGNG